jgi:hypothetical protein
MFFINQQDEDFYEIRHNPFTFSKGAIMQIFQKITRSLFPKISVATLIFVSLCQVGSKAACCLTDYFTASVIADSLTASGRTNVQIKLATCDSINISGTLYGPFDLSWNYKIINAKDCELTTTQFYNGSVSTTQIDTIYNICSNAIKRDVSAIRAKYGFSTVPNPFHTSIQFEFKNPCNIAEIRIFNANGAKIAEFNNVHSTTYTWIPNGVENGRYFVVITSGATTYSREIMYLK